jgi:hypothetical protein
MHRPIRRDDLRRETMQVSFVAWRSLKNRRFDFCEPPFLKITAQGAHDPAARRKARATVGMTVF